MNGIVPPGQGRLLTGRGNVMAFKAVAEQTGGDFSLMERTVPPGARTPPPHRHVTCSEAFFVLEGRVEVRRRGGGVLLRYARVGDCWLAASAWPPLPPGRGLG